MTYDAQPRSPRVTAWVRDEKRSDWSEVFTDCDAIINRAHEPKTQFVFLDSHQVTDTAGLPTRLSQAFDIPTIFWHDLCGESNGYFGAEESLVDAAEGQRSHRSWFRFLIKQASDPDDDHPRRCVHHPSHYNWLGMSFFAHFREPGNMVFFCFDVPKYIRVAIMDSVRALPAATGSPSSLQQAYRWHCDILDQVLLAFDWSIWSFRDVVRNLEKDRPTQSDNPVNFDALHENLRHVVHAAETLGVGVDVVEAMLAQHQSLADLISPGMINRVELTLRHREITNRLRFHVQMLKALRLRAISNEARLRNEISLAFNTVAQRDSDAQISMSESAASDNRAMKRISFVTLLLLPATAVSTIFSSAFFNFQPAQSSPGLHVAQQFWIYWVITVPLTAIVWLVWRWLERNIDDKAKKPLSSPRESAELSRSMRVATKLEEPHSHY